MTYTDKRTGQEPGLRISNNEKLTQKNWSTYYLSSNEKVIHTKSMLSYQNIQIVALPNSLLFPRIKLNNASILVRKSEIGFEASSKMRTPVNLFLYFANVVFKLRS